jgi:MFS family permease
MNVPQEPVSRSTVSDAPAWLGVKLPPTFRAFRHRNYRLYWFGQLISLIGTWMQNVAQPWLVYRLTGSPLALGFVSFSSTLPILLLAPIGGVIADRVNKHKLIVMTQVTAMTLAFILGTLAWFEVVQVWMVALLAFCLGISNAFDMPARQVFVAETVGKEDLMNAIALNSTMFNTARILGPAIAGILVASIGEAGAFLLNGVSYIAVIGMLLLMQMPPSLTQPKHRGGSVWANLLEGFRYVRHDALTRSLLLIVAVSSIFGMMYSTLMPVFAKDVLREGAVEQGLMLSAVAGGSLVSALLLATLNIKNRGPVIIGGSLVFSIALLAFAFSRSFIVSMLILPIIGGAFLAQMNSTQTVLQTNVPDQLRGRVMGVYMMSVRGMQPLAGLLGGSLATVFAARYGSENGAPLAVMVGGIVCFLSALFIVWRTPFVRKLE